MFVYLFIPIYVLLYRERDISIRFKTVYTLDENNISIHN